MKKILIGVIFFIIGAGLLVGDFYMIKSTTTFLSDSDKAEGVVVNLVSSRSSNGNTMYSPEVSFTDASNKNITFTSSISSSAPGYTVGEKVAVLYDKNNSQSAKINTFFQLWFGVMIMSILGAVFFLIGLLTVLSIIRKSGLKKDLLVNGIKILVKITSVENNSYRGQNATYQIVAQWLNPSDNQMYIFKSDDLNYDPTSYVSGKDITVYIDSSNPKRYYMDISTLPQVAN